MSPAGWGLLGTVFGAALTTAGNLLQRWLDSSTRNKAEREEHAKRTRDERKVAYLRLLTAARGPEAGVTGLGLACLLTRFATGAPASSRSRPPSRW
jgi:hypothetical protein